MHFSLFAPLRAQNKHSKKKIRLAVLRSKGQRQALMERSPDLSPQPYSGEVLVDYDYLFFLELMIPVGSQR